MNTSLTISSLTFSGVIGSVAEGSRRLEVSRGASLPEIMTVRHQPYVDSTSKLPGTRSVLRFDRMLEMTDGRIYPVSAYLVVAAPTDANVTTADIQAVVERIVSTIQEDDSGLNLADAIYVSKEQ
jgi:hypothetical protein